jgi:hypothetical protein
LDFRASRFIHFPIRKSRTERACSLYWHGDAPWPF